MNDSENSVIVDNTDQLAEYYSRMGMTAHIPVEEVLEDLKFEVRELSKQIISTPTAAEMTNVSRKINHKVVIPERNVLLKRKTQIIQNLGAAIENDNCFEFPRSTSEAINSYFNDAKKEAENIEYSIKQKARQEVHLKCRIESLKKSKSSIEDFEKSLVCKDCSILDLESLIVADFNSAKRLFNDFLNVVSPSGQLRDILEELVSKSGEEGDSKYIDITNENFDYVRMLSTASLIVKHPLKPRKICLDDFK